MDVFSEDAFIAFIAGADTDTVRGAVHLWRTCKAIRRAGRRCLALRYGCGDDVLVLWLALTGQRLSWIEEAVYPLWRASNYLWRCKSPGYKVRKVIQASSPWGMDGRRDDAYFIKDKLAGIGWVLYGRQRPCTEAPYHDVEDMVRAVWKRRIKRSKGFPDTWSTYYKGIPNGYPASYASCFEEGLPPRQPYRMEEDTNVALYPLSPHPNPSRMHDAMSVSLNKILVAYDGLVAMLEALSWETDVSFRIKSHPFCKKNASDALKHARKVACRLKKLLEEFG